MFRVIKNNQAKVHSMFLLIIRKSFNNYNLIKSFITFYVSIIVDLFQFFVHTKVQKSMIERVYHKEKT